MAKICYCGRQAPFENCCKPIIEGQNEAADPESLMRSRFSAYAIKDFSYVLNTYAQCQREQLSLAELSEDAEQTQWLKLVVEDTVASAEDNTVTFSAYYRYDNKFFKLHECSSFILEGGKWRYTSGVILKDSGVVKTQRNMPCFCGSGNKFKRCCGK